MHKLCVSALQECEPPDTLGYTNFRKIWKGYVPDIRVMTPCTDVCANCDRLRDEVARARREEQTVAAMAALTAHIDLVDAERDNYKTAIANSASESNDADYSQHQFDFVKQLERLSLTRAVSPLYFFVKYRVQIFGTVEEARHKQSNYLFGDQHSIGLDNKNAHGRNSVCSMLHHYLETTETVKRVLHLHADNCPGLNKNKTTLAYLSRRCHAGLSDRVSLSFMRVGHTSCAVD